MFREKHFENYFATVSSVGNYIRFRKVLRGNAYAMIISVSLRTDSVLPRNDSRFHPFAFATIMQRSNLEKLPYTVEYNRLL
jgi:hypothetical protein